MAARMRGITRRWIGLTPMTSMAAISSRMRRAPRSAHMAEPPAPAIMQGGGDGRLLPHDGEHQGRAEVGLGAELRDERADLQGDDHRRTGWR